MNLIDVFKHLSVECLNPFASFKECMIRALQHKANGIAFNKVHTLPITNG